MTDYPKCETCKYCIPVHCHPGNENIGKGSMSDRLGYVCTLFTLPEMSDTPKTVFRETNTGSCECHTEL